jgi:anti-sigma factor RsiW
MSGFLERVRFRLDHRWVPGRMSDYLDAQLGSGARARMQRHVGECQECRRLLAELRRTLDALHRMPAPSGGVDARAIAASVRLRLREPPVS